MANGKGAYGLKPLVELAIAMMTVSAPVPGAAQETSRYENLQVLPAEISRAELSEIMLTNLSGLGLPRRANRGCLFCHSGSREVPSSEWDWASDANPIKLKARVMMGMVQEINGTHLSALANRSAPEVEVGCYTCHAGRTNPMPLSDVLIAEFETGGSDALEALYRRLRARYYAADAYDFRPSTLSDVADRLFDMYAVEAAATVHSLNIEYTDDVRAHGGLIQLRIVQALEADGIDAMVARYHQLKAEHPEAAFRPLLLDPVAWRLFRAGQEEEGLRLMELNYEEHAEAFVANEDLAWGSELSGDHERALELAEKWVASHPDHESGRRLLDDLREGR